MPHLSLPLSGRTPIVRIGISVTRARRAALLAEGKHVPAAVEAFAIIDTGADMSAISQSLLRRLELSPTGSRLIISATHAGEPTPMPTYDVAVVLHDQAENHLIDRPVEVTGNRFDGLGFDMLLGTDILRTCLLVYDGRAASFILGF